MIVDVFRLLLLLLTLQAARQVLGYTVKLPRRFKTEGLLEYSDLTSQDKKGTYRLHYSEVVDFISRRYKLSIGTTGYGQSVHYASSTTPAVTVSRGSCETSNNKFGLIKDLQWIIEDKLTATKIEIFLRKYPEFVGPIGLMEMFSDLSSTTKFEGLGEVEYRNAPCLKFRTKVDIEDNNLAFQMDVYRFKEKDALSAIIISFKRGVKSISLNDATKFDQILKMDILSMSLIGTTERELDYLDREFVLPLAVGCSEYLNKVHVIAKSQSFSLSMLQASSWSYITLAYDHHMGYLRKDVADWSTSIWDIKRDLMYHIDVNISKSLGVETVDEEENSCSVIDVSDIDSQAFRPHLKSGEALDLIEFFGAQNLAYMGNGIARNHLCNIYETVLQDVPPIFGMVGQRYGSNNERKVDYIVQFWVLQTEKVVYGLAPNLYSDSMQFVEIVLYRRTRKNEDVTINYIDKLQIDDFHWSLYGWEKRPSEMFRASECFFEDSDRLKVEMAFKFREAHYDHSDEEQRHILSSNKFLLEIGFLGAFSSFYETSLMNVIDFQMTLRRRYVDVNLVVANRLNERKLTFFSSGLLTNDKAASRVLEHLNEENCLSLGSLIESVAFVAHCPGDASSLELETAKCFFFDHNKTPETNSNVNLDQYPCSVFQFKEAGKPQSATETIMNSKESPLNLECSLELGNPVITFTGKIIHYDLELEYKTEKKSLYKFVQTQQSVNGQVEEPVRSYNSMEYLNEGDCVKMCDLDPYCKSYSVCSDGQRTECLFSSLDIRSPNFEKQLQANVPQSSAGKTWVQINDGKFDYRLEMDKNCNIMERNYLASFTRAPQVRIPLAIAKQAGASMSTVACAQEAINLGTILNHNVGHMFASCGESHLCILDESLFNTAATPNTPIDEDKVETDNRDELLCSVYRRRYQTYFHVSVPVFKRDESFQEEIPMNGPEECARACWYDFGNVCASFDFCSPGRCLINRKSVKSTSSSKLETLPGCLHYERDLTLDKIHQQHMISRHKLLDQNDSSTFNDFMGELLLFSLLVGAFVVGLYNGVTLNERLPGSSISPTTFVGSFTNPIFSDGSDRPGDHFESGIGGRNHIDDDDDYLNSDGIQLDVIKISEKKQELEQPLAIDF